MEDLKLLSLSDLLDVLIEQTTYHTQLIASGATPEQFRVSNDILKALQREIAVRNSALKNSANGQERSYDNQ